MGTDTADSGMGRMAVRAAIVLDDGRLLEDCWDDWQREDFAALDDPRHRHAYLERPRGHSKTGDVGTEAVVELLAGRPDSRLYAFAVDETQAALLKEDVEAKLARGGHVEGGAVRIRKKEIVSARTGSVLRIMPSDASGSYGLRPDWVCFDEIVLQRDRKLWDAVWTATGKRRWCRVICISTPGWDKTGIGWEVREMARTEPNWYFSSRGQCASWIDPEWLAQQKRTLPPHVYATQHEGRWTDAGGSWLTAEEVDRIFAEGVPAGDGRRVVALDVGITRNASAAAVVRIDDGTGLYCVETLVEWHPRGGARQVDLAGVQAEVEQLARSRKCGLVCDPYQFVLGAQQLRARGLQVADDAITADTRDRMFAFVRDLATDRRLRAEPHPDLRRQLLQMSFEQHGTRLRVDHRPGGADDLLFATALGCFHLGKQLEPARRRMLQGHTFAGASRWAPTADPPLFKPKGAAAPALPPVPRIEGRCFAYVRDKRGAVLHRMEGGRRGDPINRHVVEGLRLWAADSGIVGAWVDDSEIKEA